MTAATLEFRQNNYVQIHLLYLLNKSEFLYFCSNLATLLDILTVTPTDMRPVA